jgi:hypothetical protein
MLTCHICLALMVVAVVLFMPAGSERIHGGEHGGSQATGKHFKEACHINKSLTTLGR